MEQLDKDRCCFSCLDNNSLQTLNLGDEHLKSIFQTDNLSLCPWCKLIAQRAESFIQNVRRNQTFLENFHNASTFEAIKMRTQPLLKLTTISPLHVVQIDGDETTHEEMFSIVDNSCDTKDLKIKVELEMKEEDNELGHLEGEFVDDDEFQESIIKEENSFPLKTLVKEEVEIEGDDINLNCLKRTLKKSKVKKGVKHKDKIENKSKTDFPKACTVYITKEECMKEKAAKLEDEKFLRCTYKCEDCVKGFMFKASYVKHMEKHSEENGDYVCDICKQRFCSEDKLHSHKRCHQVRYKCSVCSLTRISRHSIHDHYAAIHCFGYFQYNCPQCPKVFTRKISLRKHVCYAHTNKQRVVCAYCHKSYANKEVLKSHMIIKHAKHVGAVEESKRHVCAECGAAFKAPSHLKKHSVKHSLRRDYYCVECDKSFKSDSILKHHLKTASPHVNYLELPLPCLHCDKRFAIRRDLERHTNRVHLNIRPFQCDQCDKAYVNGWSLTEHKRIVHEGYKRPLRYPCTFCDKVFDRNQILKGHLRTHTGERPYQCTKCPAKFSQASVLGTHVKLIHLKLTRDGKPKTVNVK